MEEVSQGEGLGRRVPPRRLGVLSCVPADWPILSNCAHALPRAPAPSPSPSLSLSLPLPLPLPPPSASPLTLSLRTSAACRTPLEPGAAARLDAQTHARTKDASAGGAVTAEARQVGDAQLLLHPPGLDVGRQRQQTPIRCTCQESAPQDRGVSVVSASLSVPGPRCPCACARVCACVGAFVSTLSARSSNKQAAPRARNTQEAPCLAGARLQTCPPH